MSNRQRLPDTGPRLKCAVHGGTIGKTARFTWTAGGAVCGRCADGGALLRRLDCGHMATAGNMVVRTGAGFSCAACARGEAKGKL